MYSKEQIIEEMKRIAASMGGALSEKDFEQRSTIPLSTLRFHLGSWQRALKEARLKFVEKSPETPVQSSDELLLELIRLYKETGEIPTVALINSKGKYKAQLYTKRWKSIADAFHRAKDKFPEKFATPAEISESEEKKKKKKEEQLRQLKKLEQLKKVEELEKSGQLEPETQVEPVDQEEPAAPTEQKHPLENATNGKVQEDYDEYDEYEEDEEVILLEGENEMNHNHQGIKSEKIKFIPQTIKPQKAKVKPRVSVEPINFRGLRFAPASRQGVVYLFGMISDEMGYLIESFISEFPDCEGKRCVDRETNQWEQVRIQFEYKSSDFKARIKAKGYDENQCDVIVCWNHNWEDSPLEVLELRSVLQYLE